MEMESSLSFATFKGSVTEAITEAKNQKKLLVVYISGDDADTSSLERYTWRSLNVVRSVWKYCIFLHLPGESADGLRFSAIYAQKAIPSITVVGFDGVKLWRHAGYIDPEDLASSLEKAWFDRHTQETTAPVETTSLASNSFEVATVSTLGASTSEARLPIPENKRKPTSQKVDDGKASKPTIFIDEEKFSSECHLDGDTLVGYVDTSEDDHPDFQSANDPSPTSVEDKREECKRAERVGWKTKDKSKTVTRFEKFNDVHLKIRLVNGSSLQEKFSLTSTLHMVKEYVDNNQAADFGSYDLAIPHPLKVFDNRELSKSLSELGLFDRQTLVVVPRQRPASDGKRGYFAFAKWVLSYANPFAYLGAAASSSNSDQESQSRILEHGGPSTTRKKADPESSRSSPGRSSSVGRSGQAPAPSGWGSNIHTLKHEDDDERFRNRNAFWNGNSTVYGGDNGEAKK